MSKVLILKFALIFYSVLAVIISTSLVIIGRYFKTKGQHLYCRWSFVISGIVILPVVVALSLWIDMRYIEPNWIQVRTINIAAGNFSKELSKVKIIQISDLHINRLGFRERRLIRIVNKLKPDVLLITGDFVSSAEGLNPSLEVLSKLKAEKGIFVILGDHDDYNFSKMGIAGKLRNIGIVTLLHNNLKLNFGADGSFWLIGISDKYGKSALAGDYSYLLSAFRDVPMAEPKLLLVHNPNIAELKILAQYQPQLILAGDTHGGQLGIPFLRKYISYDEYSRFMQGLYYVQGIPLYVNRGIGMTTRQTRFFCRPEITVIRLIKA